MVHYYAVLPRSDYLCHYGQKERSGRYKWNTGKRPRQRLEKRKGYLYRRREEQAKAKILAEKKEAYRKAVQAELDRKKIKEEKERILRSGSATEVKKIASQLTTQELQDACNRIQWMQTLERYEENDLKKVKTAFQKVDGAFNTLGKVNNWGTNTIKAVQNAQTVLDMIEKSKKKAAEKAKKAA